MDFSIAKYQISAICFEKMAPLVQNKMQNETFLYDLDGNVNNLDDYLHIKHMQKKS